MAIVVPTVVLDHMYKLDDILSFFVLLAGLERVFLQRTTRP